MKYKITIKCETETEKEVLEREVKRWMTYQFWDTNSIKWEVIEENA